MSKIILNLSSSLDGFIARENGDIDWLSNYQVKPEEMPNPFEFLNSIGTLIMGANSYEKITSFGGEWAYPNTETYVVSERPLTMVNETVHLYSGDLKELVAMIIEKEPKEKDIWLVGGGQLFSSFLEEGLVDEIQLAVFPIILGNGISLFRNGLPETKLELKESKAFSSGILSLKYKVSKK